MFRGWGGGGGAGGWGGAKRLTDNHNFLWLWDFGHKCNKGLGILKVSYRHFYGSCLILRESAN